jgi:DedD protein
MDRRVKERLIGASIVVALIVLVVPELLSGPKPAAPAPGPVLPAATTPEPVRNVMVDLSTSKPPANADEEAPTQAVAAAAPAQPQNVEPNGGASSASPSLTATSVNPAPSSPPPAKAAVGHAVVESAAPSPISSVHGSWSVQLGSFASRVNADNLARQMKGQGFSSFVLTGGSGASVRYRVRVGPLSDRESAERMAAKLKSLGHVSSLVAPAG